MEPSAPFYGDIVRKLFIICGLIILGTLPFLRAHTSTTIFYSLVVVLLLAFFAGMTSPKFKKIIFSDAIVSMVGFTVFAYQGIANFETILDLLFLTNFVLAILFLFAFYWSVKSAGGVKFSEKLTFRVPRWRRPAQDEIRVSEDAPSLPKKELSEEERRKQRFLSGE